MQKIIILKIGGSLLSPTAEKQFDFEFALNLRKTIETLSGEYKFVIAVGGGITGRQFQKLAQDAGESDKVDLHKIGIAATNLNAELLHSVFTGIAVVDVLRYRAYDEFMHHDDVRDVFGNGNVVIVAGSQPGRSNDWNALEIANVFGVDKIIDVKNIDGVYSADPKKDPEAKFIQHLTWEEYLNVIGNPQEHAPGANYPVDPVTAKRAHELQIAYQVVGADLANLEKVVRGEEFHGTVIQG